jgi:hypothetical protein
MQPEGHFRLTVRQGLTPGKVFELALDEIIIGRDLKADVVLNDPEISRNHCRLTAQGNGYQVEDMESTNGTFVNNQKVTGGPRMLQPGDLVGLGENLVLEYGVSDAAAATIVMQPGAHIPVVQAPPPPPPPPVESYAPPPAALPDMGAGMPPMGEPAAPSEPAWMAAPPPPAAPIITQKKSNRNTIIAIVVAVILLCCCCSIVAIGGWYYYTNFLKTQVPTGGWLPLLSLLSL